MISLDKTDQSINRSVSQSVSQSVIQTIKQSEMAFSSLADELANALDDIDHDHRLDPGLSGAGVEDIGGRSLADEFGGFDVDGGGYRFSSRFPSTFRYSLEIQARHIY